MFRYICPIILAGGKSSRMGFSKSFAYINGISFLDRMLFLCFYLGFSIVLISGSYFNYSCICDKNNSSGPISSFYSVTVNNSLIYFSHFLFIPVDIPFLEIGFLLSLIFKSNRNFSYYYGFLFLPILLSFSYNIFFCLHFFLLTLLKNYLFHFY